MLTCSSVGGLRLSAEAYEIGFARPPGRSRHLQGKAGAAALTGIRWRARGFPALTEALLGKQRLAQQAPAWSSRVTCSAHPSVSASLRTGPACAGGGLSLEAPRGLAGTGDPWDRVYGHRVSVKVCICLVHNWGGVKTAVCSHPNGPDRKD